MLALRFLLDASIPDEKTKQQDAARQKEIQELEFPAPAEPPSVADVGKAEADEQRGGWWDTERSRSRRSA